MAQDFSAQYLDQLRFPNLPTLHLRLLAQRFIRGSRWLARRLRSNRGRDVAGAPASRELVTPAFEAGQEHLRAHKWAFFEDFLEPGFHAELRAGWPRRCYLVPASNLEKSWDRGFGWRRGQPQDPSYLDLHPALRRLFTYLRSEDFGRRFTQVVGAPDEVSCFSFVVTMTVPGSVVAPHRDDYAFLADAPRTAYNLVYFVDGTGGPGSGGLSILGTNDFDEVIFETAKLRNTALVYDTKAPFYHGFKPVERGKFRWAVISNFLSSDYHR